MSVKNIVPPNLAEYERDEEGYIIEPRPLPMPPAWDEEGYRTDYDEEEDMSDSPTHVDIFIYFLALLRWFYRTEGWLVLGDVMIMHPTARATAPDAAVFKGLVLPTAEYRKKSYRIRGKRRPAPDVVFEFASENTWKRDLDEKPARYQDMGVKEYFTYDPDTPQNWIGASTRIKGWRYSNGAIEELTADTRGWMWSEQLEMWLVPDDAYLRLHYPNGDRFLDEAEYIQQTERLARQQAEFSAEAERQAKEAERQAKEAAWAKLRELGIDPETLGKN